MGHARLMRQARRFEQREALAEAVSAGIAHAIYSATGEEKFFGALDQLPDLARPAPDAATWKDAAAGEPPAAGISGPEAIETIDTGFEPVDHAQAKSDERVYEDHARKLQ